VEVIKGMIRIGIVGSDGRWWKNGDERRVKEIIRRIVRYYIRKYGEVEVVSGGCLLGGVDVWAEEVGRELGCKVTVFRARGRGWRWFKERNDKIARYVDVLYCIDKAGRRWSGGRYTLTKARELGKWVKLIEV